MFELHSSTISTMTSPPTENTPINQSRTQTIKEKLLEKFDFKSLTRYKCRTLLAFWILGICNNYGYVVMLSAANDILHTPDTLKIIVRSANLTSNTTRNCNFISTGAILLADILPSLFIKMASPFLPFFIHLRIAFAVIVGACGYILVAFGSGEKRWLSLMGVILTSLCSGLGEASLLQYSSKYDRNVLSTWSSGTGAAGITAAVSYAALTSFGIKKTLLMMLIVPALMAVAFWIILPRPIVPERAVDENPSNESIELPLTIREKLALLPGLMKFMIPLGLVYLFEYFINQGLFELIQFEGIFLDIASQYRWLAADYQLGVFISRSSVNLIHIRHIWIMAVLQGINVVLFATEAIFYYTPYFWIVLLFTLWEGLLGGATYVNTFYTISTDVNERDRAISLGLTSFSDSIGITLSGLLAIVAHNEICKLPKPIRLKATMN